MDNTYNGWTNYATWRVNLEVFDSFDVERFFIDGYSYEPHELADQLKEYLESYIEDTTPEGLGRDYALAFISNVNYYEIATHLLEGE